MDTMKCGISGVDVDVPEIEEGFTGVVHGQGRSLVHFQDGKAIFARSGAVVEVALKHGRADLLCPTEAEVPMSEDLGEVESPVSTPAAEEPKAEPDPKDGMEAFEEALDVQLVPKEEEKPAPLVVVPDDKESN